MLSDPHFKICERAIDCNWFYNNEIPTSVAGFNPIADQAYIGRYSQFSSWLKKPNHSPRDFNFRDQLMREVLFAVHDYLPVGTTLSALTAKYHESHVKEYLRFNPKLRVQHLSFFKTLTQFYCSGKFIGFDLMSLKQSPLIYRWLEHEISYGEIQRSYTRDWLLYLMEAPINIKRRDLEKRIAVTELWQKNLVEEISEKLWEMVKLGRRKIQTELLIRGFLISILSEMISGVPLLIQILIKQEKTIFLNRSFQNTNLKTSIRKTFGYFQFNQTIQTLRQ